jgi:hypothetical protein
MAQRLRCADIVPCAIHAVQACGHAYRIGISVYFALGKNVCKGIFIARKRFRVFHNSFFVGKETVRDPSIRMDTHMRIRLDVARTATAFAVVLATISLSACGPDAGPSAASSTSNSPSLAAAAAPAASLPQTAAASSTQAASATADPVQNAEASLAADSQQITPILSYAPGETGDDSRSTATTRQQ